jgi:starvation-inducible DNA-binding protein
MLTLSETTQAGPTPSAGPSVPAAANTVPSVMNAILADLFALYVKTKSFHWHVSGPHFRDYHLLFDEQGDQILTAIDAIAERVRKVGGFTLRSVGQIAGLQRIPDNNSEIMDAKAMLRELLNDNRYVIAKLKQAHTVCDTCEDVATASLIENWIDEAEQRVWFLTESGS